MTDARPSLRSDADPSGLGGAIRRRRRALGLSQQDLADLAGVGVRLVHEVERGTITVQLGNVLRLLEALGLHLALGAGAARDVEVPPSLAGAPSAAP